MKSKLITVIYALIFIMIIAYFIWCATISYENFDVPLTQWERFLTYKEPHLFIGLPLVVLYILMSCFIREK